MKKYVATRTANLACGTNVAHGTYHTPIIPTYARLNKLATQFVVSAPSEQMRSMKCEKNDIFGR